MIFLRIIKKILKIPYLIFLEIKTVSTKIGQSIHTKWDVHVNRNKRMKQVYSALENQKEKYIGVCHPQWLGVRNSTIQIFKDERVELKEIYNDKEAGLIAKAIINADKKMVVFSGFAQGWDKIAKKIKEMDSSVIVKIILHGSNALLSEEYDWQVYKKMIEFYNDKIIDELVFVKKSMYEYFKTKGYNASFVMNDVIIPEKEEYIVKDKTKEPLKIGLYSSGDRWVKNSYNQLAAASLFENAVIDSVPITERFSDLANLYGVELKGNDKNISHEEMYKKLAANNINLYVTFTECAPLIPLESLELGTLCITGNNHHYFEGTELEKYLVVNRPDDIMAIYNQIKIALDNEDEIFRIYKEWKKEYSKEVEKSIEELLKIGE